ncbi:MAG: EAL domain-containing protein [Hyphomonas sp.]|uniref:putative bifunctional diguanylate cyclase/phosphodiesterase n=1 Tax=Hyphomonas sp. TaxID=87 RepID=UPI0018197BE9|nr:EAL domain-containing protein [Hyphomonas sp.]MBA3067276.1 EAL domain-containing protein [Hyphomonas sp.]MBU3920303.1 EAL domain-containing protein [Alphaproteobacteria bacterium]MBU4061498.1 EAL domain-containing protein [Alphaproteobacteria bacterium]MBU4163240.1 EAL domain-containing protein [Alphaproteobacteria bacterium]
MDTKQNTGRQGFKTSLTKAAEIPEKHLSSLREKQLASFRSIMLVIVLANLLNAAVILLSFRESMIGNLLPMWGGCLVLFSLFALGQDLFEKQFGWRKSRDAEQELQSLTRGATLNGFLWAIAPLVVMSSVDTQGQMVMGIVMAGMMFAGAFLLSHIPDAALSFTIPVGVGLILSMQFQQDTAYQFISVLLIVYMALLVFAVRWSTNQFVEQHLGEAAVSEQSELIGLLLRDFEESTSDWLWQTGADGKLEDIPLVIDTSSDSAGFMTKGASLVGLFAADESRKVLETAMKREQGFRDVVLHVRDQNGEECWVSLTGKPIFDGHQFRGFRGVAADITQSKQIEDRMAHMAHYDGLTGLPNRITLQEHLEKIVRKPPAPHTVRALLWMDLDNFKWVNDTLGHPAGDELLRQVAGRINEMVETTDMVARLGGDEFALIVERPAGGALEDFFHRLTDHMRTPYNIWGSTAHCSASFGVRIFDAYTTDTRQILKHADLALYDAKRTGKAQWCMFTPQLEAHAQARMQTETELEHAIDKDELRVYFQPQVDARTHKMIGAETLLRWQHPTRGLVFPDQFIELAEDNGLITRMGEWVIRTALAEAARLPEHVKVAVNLSPLQIHSATLISTIVNALAANNIAPNRFELEITESVLMTDTEFTLKRLHQIRDLGVRIALDDFGTGYSSLSYLRSFPFDKIKIDKSFVKDIETRQDSRAIAVATLNLAKSLGMRCTAEGVETLYQADFLRDHGCDELQGFLISRAQPLDSLSHIVDIRPKTDQRSATIETLGTDAEANVLAFDEGKRSLSAS